MIEKIIGKDSTYDSTLAVLAKELLGSDFKGVYSADNYPKDIKNGAYILNTDSQDGSGIHWVALYNGDAYDSFGRNMNIAKDNSENDIEQKEEEMNCGQRCLAWLATYKYLGRNTAMRV